MGLFKSRKPSAPPPPPLLTPEEKAAERERRLEMWHMSHPLSRYEVDTRDAVHMVEAHEVREDDEWIHFRQWKLPGYSAWPNSPSSWKVMLSVPKNRVLHVKL